MLCKSRFTTAPSKFLFLLTSAALCAPALETRADSATTSASAPAGSTTVRKTVGLKTAVVAASDSGGDADIALRALKAANIAMARSSGYVVISPTRVASSLKAAGLRWPFVPRDYPAVRRKLDKADRVVAVWVSPNGENAYNATVEMYDTNTGGLVGRGQSSYTATADSPALVGTTVTTTTTTSPAPPDSEPVLGSFAVPAGTAGTPATTTTDTTTATTTTTTTATTANVVSPNDPRFLAVDGAILRAVAQMNEPAQISGVIVSLPLAYQARLSMGEMHGLRNGTRIEYMVRGTPIAYGTIIDVGKGESLATVAPERAYPLLEINSEWRTANIPPLGIAGRTREEIDDDEWRRFEKEFGVGAAIAGLAYLIFIAFD